jgi:hypothetical protein
MTNFYHVQVGSLETQEFPTAPVPFWLVCFSDRLHPGFSLAQLVKAGTLVYAKREFLNHKKYSACRRGRL